MHRKSTGGDYPPRGWNLVLVSKPDDHFFVSSKTSNHVSELDTISAIRPTLSSTYCVVAAKNERDLCLHFSISMPKTIVESTQSGVELWRVTYGRCVIVG